METERISWIATSYASVHEKYNKRLPSKREKVVWSGSRINLRSINNNKVNGVTVNTPKKIYILNLHKISHAQPDQIQLIFFCEKKNNISKTILQKGENKNYTHNAAEKWSENIGDTILSSCCVNASNKSDFFLSYRKLCSSVCVWACDYVSRKIHWNQVPCIRTC